MKTAGEESAGGGNKVQKQIKGGINERDGVPSFQMFSSRGSADSPAASLWEKQQQEKLTNVV